MSHTHELCLAAELLQRPVEYAQINHNMPARRIWCRSGQPRRRSCQTAQGSRVVGKLVMFFPCG